MYPKNKTLNLSYRLELAKQAEDNAKIQSVVMEKCKNDILYFCNVFGYTYNPKIEPYDHPFITYDFQDDYLLAQVECIENGQDSITEKSREMGVSWMFVVLQVWGFLFKGWSSLYGSYKENYVDQKGNLDSNFERVRYFLQYLPHWMKPHDLSDTFQGMYSKELGTEIAGDAGQNFGTGGRRKVVFLDEFSLWQFAEKAFRKTRDVAGCRIFNGTPEGKFNVYGKIMTNHEDYAHLNITKFRLHWSLHPLKTIEWYEEEKRNRTREDVARELDISYEASIRGAVYPDFSKIATFGKYEYNPSMPLYSSWDFGRDMTAILWFQHDTAHDRFILIDSYQLSAYDREGIEIDMFAAFITGEPVQGFVYTEKEEEIIKRHEPWKNKYNGHFGDPYNAHSKTINAKSTIAEILKKHGIHMRTKADSTVEGRITKGKLFMKKLCVDQRQHTFIEAIEQSRYPEVRENSQATSEKTKPIHDANSHFRTAYEYFADNEPKILAGAVQRHDIDKKKYSMRNLNQAAAVLRKKKELKKVKWR
jgi:hypothetical protein